MSREDRSFHVNIQRVSIKDNYIKDDGKRNSVLTGKNTKAVPGQQIKDLTP